MDILQRVYDWYVTDVRDFYKRWIYRFHKRINLNDGFDPVDEDPLGCTDIDVKAIEAMRRRFDRIAPKIDKLAAKLSS